MAQSWLDRLLSGARDIGSNIADEADALAQGFTDETFQLSDRGMGSLDEALARAGSPYDYLKDAEAQLLDAPRRLLDRASESLTGAPLLRGDSPSMSRVESGASDREIAKANASLADAQAQLMRTRQEVEIKKAQQESDFLSRFNDLVSRSGKDTAVYSARGDDVLSRNEPKGGKGNFSRVSGKGFSDDVINPEVLSSQSALLNQLAREKDPMRAKVLQIAAESMMKKKTSREQIDEILEGAMKSRDPVGARQYIEARLKMFGLSPEEIAQLLQSK